MRILTADIENTGAVCWYVCEYMEICWQLNKGTRWTKDRCTTPAIQIVSGSLYKARCWNNHPLLMCFRISAASLRCSVYCFVYWCGNLHDWQHQNVLKREWARCCNFTLEKLLLFELHIRRNTKIRLIIPCGAVRRLRADHILRRHLLPYRAPRPLRTQCSCPCSVCKHSSGLEEFVTS